MEHICEILDVRPVTHDTRCFRVRRPEAYDFEPGQATLIAIPEDGFRDKKRPFTFTSLPDDSELEFIIKQYAEDEGVTQRLHELTPGAELTLHDVFGTITYQGVGTFIAGGAGVTPFIAILRQLHRSRAAGGHVLIFSNKAARDVILEDEFREMLGDDFHSVLTRENVPGHHHGRIDRDFLSENISSFSQFFYVCGPNDFVKVITDHLKALGVAPATVVIER